METSTLENKRVYCQCGCGQQRQIAYYYKDRQKLTSRYIHGHNRARNRIDDYGYKRYVTNGKKVREHRLIYELFHKCCIMPDVFVHHINGIRLDNRIENLELKTSSKHNRDHRLAELSNNKVLFGGKQGQYDRSIRYYRPVSKPTESYPSAE